MAKSKKKNLTRMKFIKTEFEVMPEGAKEVSSQVQYA